MNLLKTLIFFKLAGMTALVTRCHFRSCDKDGSHTVRSAISENHMLHANMALSFIEPELWPIDSLRKIKNPYSS